MRLKIKPVLLLLSILSRVTYTLNKVLGVSEWLLLNANSVIWQKQVNFQWDDDDEVRFVVLDQHI
jgi:hypothetical protein